MVIFNLTGAHSLLHTGCTNRGHFPLYSGNLSIPTRSHSFNSGKGWCSPYFEAEQHEAGAPEAACNPEAGPKWVEGQGAAHSRCSLPSLVDLVDVAG